jgi:hypothetical protein
VLAASACFTVFAQSAEPPGVDEVLTTYIHALGGAAAIDRITTREVQGSVGLRAHITYFWQKPDQVLRIGKGNRIGINGGAGWIAPRRGRTKKLGRGAERPLQMDANPLRYVRLKELYPKFVSSPTETVEDRAMHVIAAPNNLGVTKFYFDAETHLLRRIEETGETSAYFKTTTDFLEYKEVNATKFPFRIIHSTTEPGGAEEDFRVNKVIENVPLNPAAFSNPRIDPVAR